jgi:hypothetical protein
MEELTENYRRFRLRRRQLQTLQNRLWAALDCYEKALSAQSRQPLPFLAVGNKMASRTRLELRKRRGAKRSES